MRVLLFIMLLLPSPAFATLYEVLASTNVGAYSASTDAVSSWTTGGPPFLYFGIPMTTPSPFRGTLTWTIENGGRTQLSTADGLILIDGLTTSYSPGPGFHSSFADATIDPRMIGGITSNSWSGSLMASLFPNAAPQGDWHWEFRASTEMPEPSTLALMTPLVVGLWLWRRSIMS